MSRRTISAGKELSTKTDLYLTYRKKNIQKATKYTSGKYTDIVTSADARQKHLLDEANSFKDTCLNLKKSMTTEVNLLSTNQNLSNKIIIRSVRRLKSFFVQINSICHLHFKVNLNEINEYISSINQVSFKKEKVNLNQMLDTKNTQITIQKRLKQGPQQQQRKNKKEI